MNMADDEKKELYCTECEHFDFTGDPEDNWYGTKCALDGHEHPGSMYAIEALHNGCPLKKREECAQKSMDDDNPTIPVNRGVAGVYIPEPNEGERVKKDMMNAIARYIRVSKDEMLVENVTVDGKVYLIALTYEYPAE